jgi:cell division protein FtsB
MWDTAHKFQASYGNLMDAVEEAFQLSNKRLADEKELNQLRAERGEQEKKIKELHDKIAEINRTFIEALAKETGRVIAERDAAVKDAAMWKKSYEDLTKCL